MASFMSNIVRRSAHVNLWTKLHGMNKIQIHPVVVVLSRNIYGDSYLNIDKFIQHRERISGQYHNIKTKFTVRIRQYLDSDTHGMVFTDDLKHVIHLAENDPEDIELLLRMLKKFRSQNKELRFDTYNFGPVVMRLFHYLNMPDQILELLEDPDMVDFFDQVTSYTIALNLFYKNGRYDDVIKVYDLFRARDISGRQFPKEGSVLLLGAYYKLNTPESLKKVVEFLQEAKQVDAFIMRQGVTFAAALALKQNDPAQALGILSMTKQSNYFTVKNLKIVALSQLNRVEDAILIMQNSLQRDVPDTGRDVAEYCEEVVSILKEAINQAQNKEQALLFQRVEMALRERRLIRKEDLEDAICQPVLDRPPPKRDTRITGFESRFFLPTRDRNDRDNVRRHGEITYQRKGLLDSED